MNSKEIIKNYVENKINNSKAYHSSFENFDKFDFSESPFGMHFGTLESATNRINVKILEDERLGGFYLKNKKDNPIMYEVSLSHKKPIFLNESRTGSWRPHDVLIAVMEKAENEGVAGITEQEIEDYYNDELTHDGIKMIDLDIEEYDGEDFNLEKKEHYFVRNWLESKGYDSIVYENEFEGGGKSVLLFREKNCSIINKDLNFNNKSRLKNKI